MNKLARNGIFHIIFNFCSSNCSAEYDFLYEIVYVTLGEYAHYFHERFYKEEIYRFFAWKGFGTVIIEKIQQKYYRSS